MAFVNWSLVLGTMLIGLPIALHLIMRQKPKPLIFPAIRFIQKRHESNRRTLRLRHWLLLLLRCLVIALAALALARPSVSSGMFGNWIIIALLAMFLFLVSVLFMAGLFTKQGVLVLAGLGGVGALLLAALVTMVISTLRQSDASMIGDHAAPVAAVMVLDSSPRMQYRHRNMTRLEQARETADWLARQLPPDSKLGILDSRAITPVFSVDLSAARKMIQRVQTTGAPRSLDQLLDAALQLLAQSSLKRKEIYVLTDLTEGAWQVGDPVGMRRRLEKAKNVSLYLIDVGIEDPQNFALGDLNLSAETLPENDELVVTTTISSTGAGGKRSVEFYVEDVDRLLPLVRDGEVIVPASKLRKRQEVTLKANDSREIEFSIPGLTLGTRHAELRIAGQDALMADNSRYLTVVVREPWLVLIAAPRDVNTSAFVEAIAPLQHREENRAAYQCLTVSPDEITNHSLADFAAVVLIDPTPLPVAAWKQLGAYVREGGQLALFLGHNASNAKRFNSPEALELLPGKLGRQYRVSGRDIYLAPHSYDHPVLRTFRSIASTVPWDRFPIFRYWSLRDIAPDAQVILRYGNNQPALLERTVDKGTVVTMTTPITELERPRGRQAWNELAGPNGWPRFVLVNDLMQYLTQHNAGQFVYESGQYVVLENRATEYPSRYLMFMPNGETQPVQARDDKLSIRTTEPPGTYRLKGDRDGPIVRGFSVNLPARASRLERTTAEKLDALLGAERYQLARDREQIVRVQGRQRAGREFFPFLMALLAMTLVLEQLLANRFYRDTDTSSS